MKNHRKVECVSDLTGEEFAHLLRADPRKKRAKNIKISLGIVLEVVAVLIFLFSWTFDGLSLDLEYGEGMPYIINLSIVVGILLSLAGFLLIGSFALTNDGFKANDILLPIGSRKKEIPIPFSHNSPQERLTLWFIPISRIIASLIFILMAYWNYKVFGIFFAETSHMGNFFFLNGPSMWIPMSFLPTIAVIWFTGHTLVSSRATILSRSARLITFKEYGIRVPTITEIPKSEIEGFHMGLKNNGSEYLWIFLLGFSAVRCLISGSGFLFGEYTYGTGLIVGKMYLITALSDIIGIAVLVFGSPTSVRIVTHTQEYEFKVSRIMLTHKNRQILVDTLQENVKQQEKWTDYPPQSKKFLKTWRGLIIGVTFILIGLISNIYPVYVGIGFQKIFFVFGFYLLVKNTMDKLGETCKFHEISSHTQSITINVKHSLQPLNFIDIIMGILFPIFLALDSLAVIYFNPSGNTIVIHIFGTIGIFSLLFLYFLRITGSNRRKFKSVLMENKIRVSFRILVPLLFFCITGFILGFIVNYLLYQILFGVASGIFLIILGISKHKFR